ncbi:MAG: type II toxin-antitoxin system HipA family toxin [Steroidobacteraceae bacterium]
MTSEAFVYLVLPGTTDFVPAGRFVLAVDRSGVPFGRFVYGRGYLGRADAVPIDPIELPLSDHTYETERLKGMFGALRDAGPDYWGRRIIEKYAGLGELGELDYLLHSPDDRAGALGFGIQRDPPAPLRAYNRTVDLERLQTLADRLIAQEGSDASGPELRQVEDLLLLGTSMGGARPKAVIEDAGHLWVAKFNRQDDQFNCARVEHAMLLLGRECGMSTAESRVARIGARDVLLVKRFDRMAAEEGAYRRARMLSALTILRTGDSHQDRDRWSYVRLAEELRRVSREPKEDSAELFRRMTFNALISNTDDHPRNHAVIATGNDFRLSPAYDLVPFRHVSLERRDLALTVGTYGRYANAANLVSQAARFLLDGKEAARIVDAMEACVRARWYAIARREGVSEPDCEDISGAFAYPGFRYSVTG